MFICSKQPEGTEVNSHLRLWFSWFFSLCVHEHTAVNKDKDYLDKVQNPRSQDPTQDLSGFGSTFYTVGMRPVLLPQVPDLFTLIPEWIRATGGAD